MNLRLLLTCFVCLCCSAFSASSMDWSPEAPERHDIVFGVSSAPVTITEYASLTCPHCARFHLDDFVDLKAAFIDTGKVRYVYRHFPLDQSALAGAMALSCVPDGEKPALMKDLYLNVQDWAPEQDIAPLLLKHLGGEESVRNTVACMAQEGYPEQIMEVASDAMEFGGVDQTPTFFVNGKRISGSGAMSELKKELAKVN